MGKQITQDQILSSFKNVRGDRYDYSLVEYKNTKTKVKVVCRKHGIFEINLRHHINGVGCRYCYFESRKTTKEEFVHRSKHFFGDLYDYSLFDEMPLYNKKVPIRCVEHEIIFEQNPRIHIQGHTGCPKCKSAKLAGSNDNRGKYKTQAELTREFIGRAKEIHGERYDYSEFIYSKNSAKSKIICKIHGSFLQQPSNHLSGNGCPKCAPEDRKEGTFKRLCKEKGVDYYRALKRRQAGLKDEKIFAEGYIKLLVETQPITVYEKTYPNLQEAIRNLNPPANRTTIARWLKANISPEEAFERIPNPGYADGVIYLITHKASRKQYVGLTVQNIERRWKNHQEQAYNSSIASTESLHAAIREFGADAFSVEEIDKGSIKIDLKGKEKDWIKKLNTLAPNGYNISTGGTSGGSNSKAISIDGIKFKSRNEANQYVANSRNISIEAAKARVRLGRIDVKSPPKPGNGVCHTKAYKAWSRIVHQLINPKSKDYIEWMEIFEPWRIFDNFLKDVGNQTDKNMSFIRIDKTKGYFPNNCTWMTKCK